MLGGIVVIDAADLNEAVRLASTHPIARIGAVEVRPSSISANPDRNCDRQRSGRHRARLPLRTAARAGDPDPPSRQLRCGRGGGAGGLCIAARQWPKDGVPANPYAWLVSTGRFQTIDRWRRRAKIAAALPELAALADTDVEMAEPDTIRDDELP